MADKRISQLDELTSIDPADLLAIVDASVPQTKRTTISTLLSYIFANTSLADLSDVNGTVSPSLNALLVGDGTEWEEGTILSVLPSASGQGGKVLALTVTEDGLEWVSLGSGGGGADLNTANTWTAGQRGEITALTDGATITPDFADSNFFSVTLGGNRTLANPTNIVAGQSGSVFITQDATGSRTLAYGSYWDFAGGAAPTLSTAANTVDRLDYVVRTSTSIHAVLTKAWS